MKKLIHTAIVAVLAAEVLVLGQGSDINKVMSDVRAALGGAKSAEVKTLSAIGRTTRTRSDGTASEQEFELSLQLPDKYMKRDVLMSMGPTSIYRNTGFNGDGLINLTDTPPSLASGGGVRMVMIGPGSAPAGAKLTPEETAELNRKQLVSTKQDFARLTLGMFAQSFPVYPLQFTSGGVAESADGAADVVVVRGDGEFDVKLFIDQKTHLPLMLSWMAKEPLQMNFTSGSGRAGGGAGPTGFSSGGGNVQVVGAGGGGGARGGQQMTPEQMAQMQKEMDARMAEAEKNRKVVEYRMFYADYKTYDGVKLPTRIQRMVDGKPTEELAFDKIKLNAKIDPK
ncbi:MAG TPA: hypothetical protein VFV98_19120, partial [Vicinamibacterales bacterium]|nr:hypothetical protein [Vicinamibacterales bacterium]